MITKENIMGLSLEKLLLYKSALESIIAEYEKSVIPNFQQTWQQQMESDREGREAVAKAGFYRGYLRVVNDCIETKTRFELENFNLSSNGPDIINEEKSTPTPNQEEVIPINEVKTTEKKTKTKKTTKNDKVVKKNRK